MQMTQEQAEAIASKFLDIDTLTTRNRDCLDFHQVAVWQVLSALQAAYDLGAAEAGKKSKKTSK